MPPLNLLIKPASSLCNMRCKYCFYADVSSQREVRSYGQMSKDTLEAMVRAAFAYAEGSVCFAFQGGEPLLAGLEYYRRFIALVRQYNTRGIAVQNAIQTNGLLIDDEWAAFFAKHRFLVGLSMDGTQAIHDNLRRDNAGKGTYRRVEAAAGMLHKHRCEVNILCVVTRPVARAGAQVYQALRKHRYLQFIPCIDDFEGAPGPYALTAPLYGQFLRETFDLYYQDYLRGEYVSVRNFDNYVHMLLGSPPESCAMAGQCTCNLVIEGDGGAYPCDFYVLDEWFLGNIQQDGIPALRNGERAKQFVEASHAVQEACKACPWGALCRGGCRRDREAPGGIGPNRFCEAYQAFFRHAMPGLQALARREMASHRRG